MISFILFSLLGWFGYSFVLAGLQILLGRYFLGFKIIPFWKLLAILGLVNFFSFIGTITILMETPIWIIDLLVYNTFWATSIYALLSALVTLGVQGLVIRFNSKSLKGLNSWNCALWSFFYYLVSYLYIWGLLWWMAD